MDSDADLARRHAHHHAHRVEHVRVALVTASDSRTLETDASGRLLREGLEAAGHEVTLHRVVPDEPEAIVAAVGEGATRAEVVITSGGTGITHRDWTYEAVAGLLDKRLDGFGELFRMLSWDQVGAAAYLSRATAGLMGDTAVFVLPGSSGAVTLALEKLILPELGHVAWLAARDRPGGA